MIDPFEKDYKRAEGKLSELKKVNERRKNAISSSGYTTKVYCTLTLV